MIAGAEYRLRAVDALSCRAPAAGHALVAGLPGWIAEIGAACPLQHVSAECGHVPQLRAGGKRQALDDDGIVGDDLGMRRDVGHRCEGAEPEGGLVGSDIPQLTAQGIEIDDALGPHHIELHQIQQGRAACQKRSGRLGIGGKDVAHLQDGVRERRSACVSERPHDLALHLRACLRHRGARCWDRRRSGTDCRSYTPGYRRPCRHDLRECSRWPTGSGRVCNIRTGRRHDR